MYEQIDITDRICPLLNIGPADKDIAWPMYSFDAPSYMLWNEVANQLKRQGWSENKIKEWLQSKNARWALDGELGDAIRMIAKLYAMTIRK